MEVKSSSESFSDFEVDQILHRIENDNSDVGFQAMDFLIKMAYCDQSQGVDTELCYMVISRTNSFRNSNLDKNGAGNVLQVLQDHKAIHEKRKKNSNCSTSFQMLPGLQEKLLIRNRQNSAVITELASILHKIWLNENIFAVLSTVSHAFHIHKSLKDFNWPDESITCSVYFAIELLIDACTSNMEIGLQILEDATGFLKSINSPKSLNKANWLAIQMIRIHNKTIMKSRKILQPSDMICLENIDGTTQDIRLDNYGNWILDQIRFHTESKIECDALILVGVATLERLQKHARFCNQPEEMTLDWILSYNGKEWHNVNCFAALACFGSTDGWLEKVCRAYIKKLNEEMTFYGNSDYTMKNVYLSWVCLRDLIKTSRICEQMISALTDQEGLQFLYMNFEKCESLFESKEYYLKYQGQTVIEMLTPLLTHGKSDDTRKLLKSQEFWNFVNLVLIKHPFIKQRYDVALENDLLCACEVNLDLLIAICNRNHDAISEGFLKSFLSKDYLQTFTTVLKEAGDITEPRQRHSCDFYLFTVLFTLLDISSDTELADTYFNDRDIINKIEELSEENFKFEVQKGCLREYRNHLKNFIELYKNRTNFANSNSLKSIANLVHNMSSVAEKYDWESDTDENL